MKTNRFLFLIISALLTLAVARDCFGANTTIKDIATTSVLPATNDFTVQDGATYGTRKLSAVGYTYLTATRTTLAALSITGAADGLGILVLGASAAGDGGGASYFWSASSTATPNGNTVILPASAPGTGRWLKATGNIGFPGPSTIGGIFSNAGTTHQWVSAINTDGTVTFSQPAYTDISGLSSMATQSSGAVAITGGTINGVTIGGSTPAAGTFSAITATSASTGATAINLANTSSGGRSFQFFATGSGASTPGQLGLSDNTSSTSLFVVSPTTHTFTMSGIDGTPIGANSRQSAAFTSVAISTPLAGDSGGTGVSNSGKTVTLGGNLTTSGAFNSTFTMTAGTSVTFPTTGTLATLLGTEAMANKTITASAFNGTIGATTPSSAVVSVLTRTGTSTNNSIWGVVSDATTYNMLTFNNVATIAGLLGIAGGGGSDKILYLKAPTGGAHEFDINGVSVGQVTATGLNSMVIGATTAAAGTFTIVSSGTASTGNSNLRTTKGNYNLALNVKDFGAACDGSTNDTVAVAAAVAALPSTNASLYFPGLTVSDTVTITGKTGLTIYADGNGSGGLKNRTGGVVLSVSSSSAVTIRGMTLDGNCSVRTPGQTVADLDVSNGLIFTNNTIKNAGQYNLLVGGHSTQNTNVNITNNVLLGGYADGINIQYVAGFVVANNNIASVDDDCIAIGYNGSGFATDGIVANNKCKARNDLGTNTGRGIWVGKAQDILIDGNSIESVKQTGIFINDDGTGTRPARITVHGNKIHNVALSSGHGIAVYKADYVTLEGNVVEDPHQGSCIEIADWQHLTIKGGVLTQSNALAFCRGIHADESNSWSATWTDLTISGVDIRMLGASTDRCIYLAPDASVTMNTGSITEVHANQVTSGVYAYVDAARAGVLWKIGNNTALFSGGSTLPASSSGVFTVFNNN